MRKHLPLICWLIITLGWMALIFSFSAQSGEESGGLSAIIAKPVTEAIVTLSGGMSAEEEAALYMRVDGAIRICAHFSEYALLGVWLTMLCHSLGQRMLWLPWLAGTVFAISDEWHQSFSPGRVADPLDVAIDALGVMTGVIVINILKKIWRKKHVHHS